MRLEWVGWVATGAFAASYFCKGARSLRLVQALAAVIWIGYGLMIHALPVVVSNVVVAAVAGWSAIQRSAVSRQRSASGEHSRADC